MVCGICVVLPRTLQNIHTLAALHLAAAALVCNERFGRIKWVFLHFQFCLLHRITLHAARAHSSVASHTRTTHRRLAVGAGAPLRKRSPPNTTPTPRLHAAAWRWFNLACLP